MQGQKWKQRQERALLKQLFCKDRECKTSMLLMVDGCLQQPHLCIDLSAVTHETYPQSNCTNKTKDGR